MRKFVTFCISLLACAAFNVAHAEVDNTFHFVDKNGQVVPDGSTINVTKVEIDDDFGNVLLYSGLSVKNNSSASASMIVKYNISHLDNGKFNMCFPNQCTPRSELGEYKTDAGSMKGGETLPLQSDWEPSSEVAYGKCTVTYQLIPVKIKSVLHNTYDVLGEGFKVTVNFIYNDPAGGNKDDLNGDGTVNVSDVTMLINAILLGETASQFDIDDNGTVNVSDVTMLINHVLMGT